MGKWVRGIGLIAADAYCWYKVKENGDEGREIEDEYYVFADDHWSEEHLFEAYSSAILDDYRWHLGQDYFGITILENDLANLDQLSLWVSKEDDRREYYENLGKWDQFVFGWDDFIRPDVGHPDYPDFEPSGTFALSDLRQPWVSRNREIYREMRVESNDAFKTRDRWLYVNIGMRVFSVLQVAYLQGLLGGGPANNLEMAGHSVEIIAQPYGFTRGVMAAKVSF